MFFYSSIFKFMLSSRVSSLRHIKLSLFVSKNFNPFSEIKRSYHLKLNILKRYNTKHLIGRFENQNLKSLLKCQNIRYASTGSIDLNIYEPRAIEKLILRDIPDPPIANVEDLAARSLNIGEPFSGLIVLGEYTPVDIIQDCLECLHISCDLPWWSTIVTGTLILRILMFPFVIMAQRQAAKISNNLPQMQVLQTQMTEAKNSENIIEFSRLAQELLVFIKQRDLSPFKILLFSLLQAPFFIFFFTALRNMINAPIESMRQGGLFWFTDLTLADPTFILPFATSLTLLLSLEMASKNAVNLSTEMKSFIKYSLRALPFLIFPFTMDFSAAILVYWTTSNLISLSQVSIFKIAAVRKFFKISLIDPCIPFTVPFKKPDFVKDIQKSLQNMKICREIGERRRMHEMRSSKARRDDLIKTIKEDFLTERENLKAMVDSKRNKY